MTRLCVKATLAAVLAVLAACTDLSQAPDPIRAEAELQAAAGYSVATSHTHDFERAMVLASDRER